MRDALDKASAHSRALEQQVARLEAECTELHAQLAETARLCELQQADLDRYKKAFDASRPNHPERAPSDQLQLAFERVIEMLGAVEPANDSESDSSGKAEGEVASPGGERARPKKRHSHGRRNLDKMSLPVVEQRIEPEEVMASGGEGFELIGEEVSERLAYRPGQWFRLRVVRPKYAKRESATGSDAASDGTTRITIASLPSNIWPNVMADPSGIAHIAVSKYGDLLPLNRQQSIFARGGFWLPKSTQSGWLNAASGFCRPVVEAMFDDARRNAFLIATDATGASVLPPRAPPGEGTRASALVKQRRCESWHVFVFIADRDHVIFRYNREHNGAVFAKMLEGYHGNLLADAASVFDVLYREHGMTEHGCWFHCRRPFYRALETDPPRALEALSLIGKLFEVDRELRREPLDLETFTRLRRERAGPILKLIDDWVALNRDRVDPRSPLDSAIGYYRNQREALHRFLDDGRIRLDNNLSEQALRNLVVGLSNWVFFANETGIAWYTIFRSLIASCALHRLNPETYLEQLLRLVPHWPKKRVLELAPKYWTGTVDRLDANWRAILERPWEPGVVVPAQLAPPRPGEGSAAGRAA